MTSRTTCQSCLAGSIQTDANTLTLLHVEFSSQVWKKRCVAIQPDEFADDPSNPCLVLSVYSGESGAARKHSASFWKSVSCHKAVVYRSSSRTHKYAFTVSDDQGAVVHLSAESEALAQEWMAAIRAILWPPSPVVQLEKMLNGCQFEISIIDNDFSFRAGLLGAYGHLTITPRKLILVHPQQGYVVQEWYLNTVDKFQLVPQTRIEDVNKVLAMTTCSDSSTGRGDILIFCREAVGLLQAVASTIHSILTQHSTEEGGTYQKELEEIGQWLDLPQPQEDYYKVPPRQVKSLLDIPNFIFNKPIISTSTVTSPPGSSMAPSESEDFLNCSVTSFVVGGGKSSDSELSDTYTPPRSPEMKAKKPT
ncbi:PH domain-containing protein [Trichonephila inaurata madagascariensis]|uniref:PH domain-containing protein n=1 Tax=Trichonephila inaurata madagascariensis TaxID=2747483 RepID=A0A8X6XSJ5_9ARAC|nr:PH domain-containing protein [Trichonephila inaurata madagascariensis]